MKYILLIFISLNLYSNDFDNNCKKCHSYKIGNYPLSFEKINSSFTEHEFLSYLKYEKNKSSVHNTLIEDNNTSLEVKTDLLKSSSLSYQQRQNIVDYIYKNTPPHVCSW